MLAWVVAAVVAAATSNGMSGTVFTKDGGRVRGNVLEAGPAGVTVRLPDGSVRWFDPVDVRKLVLADGGLWRPGDPAPQSGSTDSISQPKSPPADVAQPVLASITQAVQSLPAPLPETVVPSQTVSLLPKAPAEAAGAASVPTSAAETAEATPNSATAPALTSAPVGTTAPVSGPRALPAVTTGPAGSALSVTAVPAVATLPTGPVVGAFPVGQGGALPTSAVGPAFSAPAGAASAVSTATKSAEPPVPAPASVASAPARLTTRFTPMLIPVDRLDTVYLVSGGRVRAFVTEETPERVVVRLVDGTERRYPPIEVAQIAYADGSASSPSSHP